MYISTSNNRWKTIAVLLNLPTILLSSLSRYLLHIFFPFSSSLKTGYTQNIHCASEVERTDGNRLMAPLWFRRTSYNVMDDSRVQALFRELTYFIVGGTMWKSGIKRLSLSALTHIFKLCRFSYKVLKWKLREMNSDPTGNWNVWSLRRSGALSWSELQTGCLFPWNKDFKEKLHGGLSSCCPRLCVHKCAPHIPCIRFLQWSSSIIKIN